MEDVELRRREGLANLIMTLGFAVVITAVSIVTSLVGPDVKAGRAALAGMGVLICVTGMVCGSALGFIFGIPKSLSSLTAEHQALAANSQAGEDGQVAVRRPLFQSNTNLERISDWLTTMIVGVTLIELGKINELLLQFSEFLAREAQLGLTAQGVPTAGGLPAVGPVALIVGAVCGFLFMYLTTRLLVTPLLDTTEGLLSRTQSAQIAAVKKDDPDGARSTLIDSLRPTGKRLSVEDAIGSMFDALYKRPPRGFTEAISIGAVLASTPAVKDPDYWFYLAAAFGQKHHYALRTNGSDDDLQSARDNALDAARRAIALDKSYRRNLRDLMSSDGVDNDLQDFADDAEFVGLVRSAK